MLDPITSPHNPRVKAVVRLREHRERRATGRFIAEGTRELTRAVAAGLRCVEWFACPELLHDDTAAALRDAAPLAPTPVTPAVLGKMAYHRKPEGALGVFEQPAPAALPPAHDDRIGPVLLVAVGTEKPGNLGAMARTAAAAGCAALVTAGTPVDAFNPNAIRASTAAVFTLPVVTLSEADAIAQLRDAGYRLLVGTPATACTTPHAAADYAGPIALVVGPEDTGLAPAWLDAADARLTIPMTPGPVDSLNASVSAAVLLFEAMRQRGNA